VVLEVPIPNTAAGRPPIFGGPPIGTTFSNEPDDRDDMIVSLRENVQRLVAQAESADRGAFSTYLRLLDQRRDWVKGELSVEGMLSDVPKAPLGIPENIYDLATLSCEPVDERRRAYQRMLDLIDRTMAGLWERMLACDEATE
jgi:hypothetical protein